MDKCVLKHNFLRLNLHSGDFCPNFAIANRKRNDTQTSGHPPKSEENIDIMLPRQSSESCFKSTGTYIKVSSVNPKDNKRNSDRDNTIRRYIEIYN